MRANIGQSSSLLYLCPHIQIKRARDRDRRAIWRLHLEIKSPHARRINIDEYFVAIAAGKVVGCAAIRRVRGGGYLYGRAVRGEWRQRGIGTALIVRRLEWLRARGAKVAVGLVMFWNVSVFRKLGFQTIPRAELPMQYLKLGDFRNERNCHCATLLKELQKEG